MNLVVRSIHLLNTLLDLKFAGPSGLPHAFLPNFQFDDLDANPLAGYQMPAATACLTAFTPAQEKRIYDEADEAFGNFIKTRILTGGRLYPELARAEVKKTEAIFAPTELRSVDATISDLGKREANATRASCTPLSCTINVQK